MNHSSRSLWNIITIYIISFSCLRVYFLDRSRQWIWEIKGSLWLILQSFDNYFFNQWLFRRRNLFLVQNFCFITLLLVPIFRQTLLLDKIPPLFRFILWILALRLFAITISCKILTFKTWSCWDLFGCYSIRVVRLLYLLLRRFGLGNRTRSNFHFFNVI